MNLLGLKAIQGQYELYYFAQFLKSLTPIKMNLLINYLRQMLMRAMSLVKVIQLFDQTFIRLKILINHSVLKILFQL